MAKQVLTFEERRAIEDVLEMSDGYVLDFTNETFAEFFQELGFEVIQDASKAKWLRGFFATASPQELFLVLTKLMDHRTQGNLDTTSVSYRKYLQALQRLPVLSGIEEKDDLKSLNLSLETVNRFSSKARQRLLGSDFDGAISVARTLVESTLEAIESEVTGSIKNYKGDLQKQFKEVSKLISIDTGSSSLDEGFKMVARGLGQVVAGVAVIRNSASDSHAPKYLPEQRHAELAVNAAQTVARFLVSVHSFQKSRQNSESLQ